MATKWYKVPQEILDIANGIIEEFHPDLLEFRIGFIFRSEATMSKGRKILGQASKITGKYSAYIDLDGLVWLAADEWFNLNSTQKQALIDHELCHFEVVSKEDGDSELTMKGHDIEEFRCIVERYGFWSPDLKAFVPTVLQVKLPGFERNNGGVIAVEPSILTE